MCSGFFFVVNNLYIVFEPHRENCIHVNDERRLLLYTACYAICFFIREVWSDKKFEDDDLYLLMCFNVIFAEWFSLKSLKYKFDT